MFITRSTFSDNDTEGASTILTHEGSFTTITDSALLEITQPHETIFNLGVMFVTNTTIARNVLSPFLSRAT